jgi:hypothetical protein
MPTQVPDPDAPGMVVLDGRAWPLVADARYEFTGQQLAELFADAACLGDGSGVPELRLQAWAVEKGEVFAGAHVTPGQQALDARKIINVFLADMPETVRILNAPAIVEEVECGRDVTLPEEELPPQEVYDRYERVLGELVDTEVLQTGDYLGETVYGLTTAVQQRVKEQVQNWLKKRMEAERVRAERGDISWETAGERGRVLNEASTILNIPMEGDQ